MQKLYLENVVNKKGERAPLTVTDLDMAKVTWGPGFKGIVTDRRKGGQRWRIYGAACGLNCYCAAIGHLIK